MRILCPLVLTFVGTSLLPAQIFVTMDGYDLNRTGANSQEQILKPSNVDAEHFGKLFERKVDASVYARPLIVSGVEIDGAKHNVLYIATMENTVYAFDADDPKGKQFWKRKLGLAPTGDGWIGPIAHGILSTPYIDTATGTLYTVTKVVKDDTEFWLNALDIRTGQPKYKSPQRFSFPFADGTVLTNVPTGIQRPGLVMSGDTLIVGFASILPEEMQEGFLQAFDAHDLSKRRAVFQVTPTGLKGGIWQAGRGLAVDAEGFVYAATAGGSFDGATNFGSSVLKLAPDTLTLKDSFTPRNHEDLYHRNIDLSAGGVTLIPGTSLMFAGGKEGVIYLLDRNHMGGLETETAGPVQRFRASAGCGRDDCYQTLGTAFFSHPGAAEGDGTLYVWDKRDVLRAYPFRGGRFETEPSSTSAVKAGLTSGPAVSSNGGDPATGIVWAVTIASDDQGAQTPGTLRAYLAADLTREIYNSGTNKKRDTPGDFSKYSAPVIANGKVYVVSQSGTVAVFGLLPEKR